MHVADPLSTSQCETCQSPLSDGVCVSCAFIGLLPDSEVTSGGRCKEAEIEFGRYLLQQRLAAGGMGVVYSAQDRQLKRTVALKMIRGSTFANASEIARFTIEAEAAAALDHPNIVPIYEVGSIEEQPFFTMKLIEGKSLRWHLKNSPGGKVATRQIVKWLSQIARAVHHAHQRGVLHRDLKPGNILIDEAGFPWLTDFGLAKLMHGDCGLTMSTDHLGTPNYMPPEVVTGTAREVSTASDVWALGVILWEAICGKLPFAESSPVKVMRRIAEDEPTWPQRETIDKDLLTLASRCLEKDPARRLQSADQVAEELDRWLNDEPLSVRRITTIERVLKWMRRKPVWAALVTTLFMGGLLSFWLWQRAEGAVDSLTGINDQLRQSLAISTATKLAIDARLGASKSPVRSLQRAVEAVEITERAFGVVLPEAADSLLGVLQLTGGWDVSPMGLSAEQRDGTYVDTHAVRSHPIQCSPDGRWILTFDYLNGGLKAALFDLQSEGGAAPLFRWTVLEKHLHLRAASWLDDSSRFVTVDQTGAVRLWELPLGEAERLVNQISDLDPPSRLLGSLAQHDDLPTHVWLKNGDDLSTLEGVAIYQGSKTDLLTFEIATDATLPLVEKQLRPLAPIVREESSWTLSPCWQWLWHGESEKVWLYKLDMNAAGFPCAQLPEDSKVWISQFSPNGRWLALRRDARRVHIYDLQSGSPHLIPATGSELYVHDSQIETIAFSPDGEQLAVAGRSPNVAVISTESGAVVDTLRASGEEVYTVSFLDDGRWLGAGSRERMLSMWPTEEFNRAPEPLVFLGAATPILEIALTPNRKSLIATCAGASYRQWSFDGTHAGTLPQLLPGGEAKIIDMERSPGGKWIVAARSATGQAGNAQENKGTIRLIDTTRQLEVSLAGSQGISSSGVAFSPDGKWIASTGHDGLARVWDFPSIVRAVRSGSQVPGPTHTFDMTHTRLEFPRRVAFHPRGILFCACGDGILFEWNLNDPNPAVTKREHPVHTRQYLLPDVRVSPDGKWLAIARHAWDSGAPIEGSTQQGNMVLLYDVSKPGIMEFHVALPANFRDETNLDFSSDSRWLAAGSRGKGPCVWDLAAANIEQSRREAEVSAHVIAGVAFSPDGRWLGLGGSDGHIHLWDWRKNGQSTRTITSGNPESTLLWLDDTRLVSGGASGEMAVWETDIARLKQLARRIAGTN